MKCKHISSGFTVAERVEEARSFKTRLLGLMFRKKLAAGSGLLLAPCQQIHMCFMNFAIDVLFCDKAGVVVGVLENFKPWRISRIFWAARQALELPAGTLKGRVRVGDKIEFIP